MNYFVVDQTSGQKYGPADLATLNQWVVEGRVTPTTMLEDAATGQQVLASSVPGLSLGVPPTAAPPPAAAPVANPYPRQFEQAPGLPVSSEQSGLITASYILSAVGLCVCPIAFSGGAIACAVIAKNRGDQRGQTAMIVGIVSLVAGIIIGVVLATTGALTRLGR